jgi:hypothetical protein
MSTYKNTAPQFFPVLLVFCLLICNTFYGQQYRIKAAVFAFPVSFAMANAGAEYINKSGTASWQALYNITAGSVALDAGETHRQWVTIDRIWYKGKNTKVKFLYNTFIEAGKRIKYPGFIHPPLDSIPKQWVYSEVCPGVAIGFNVAFGKHMGLQAITGPKLIITLKGTEHLSNANTNSKFSIADNRGINIGFRFTGCLYYQFAIKKSSR